MAGARVRVDETRDVDVWTAHFPSTPYRPYEAAFDGLPVRLARMRDTLRRIAHSAGPGRPVIRTGDFDTPSHLDWPDVPWPVTQAAEKAGLRDSYREAHPGPAAGPGHTWSPVHREHEDGSGRPEPHDRIDYVLHNGQALRVLAPSSPAPHAPGPTSPATTGRPTTPRWSPRSPCTAQGDQRCA
ncbi:hypothetical protein ACFYOA_31765 [Streptomyces iakyrus]|uniref:hypothetical protein n=1 Tax=Streptomyces iakyrus TaxID=68219 RepID=UPI0036760E19